MRDVAGKLKVTCNDDGSVTLDARGLAGDEADLIAELEELAREVGGELLVEKHEPGHKHHHHEHSHGGIKHRH